MKKILHYIDEKFEEVIGVILICIVVILLFIGVVMRLGFRTGMPLEEELSRILYVILIHLGASYGIKYNDHIRVTFIYNMLPQMGKIITRIITDVIWAAYQIMVIILSIDVYREMAEYPGYTAVLMLPLHLVFAIIPISFSLITIRLIQKFILDWQAKSLEIKT